MKLPSLSNNKDKENGLSRRGFLGMTSLAAAAALTGCGIGDNADKPTRVIKPIRSTKGNMSYRINEKTGHNISVLSYGTGFLPTIRGTAFTPDNMDQEAVDKLLDYALDHGVNYFNTAPTYSGGLSESVVGNSLSRHPRESFYLATKISNFAPEQHSLKAGIEMFHNSLKALKTTYIDNILLHDIGYGGLETFKKRFINNGMLDYLREQREKGTLFNIGLSFSGDIKALEYALEMQDKGEIDWDFAQMTLNYVDWYHPSNPRDKGTDAQYVYRMIRKRKLPIVAVNPLKGGLLGNVPRPIMREMIERRPDDSVSSWAMRFVGELEGVVSIVTGMSYAEHLKDHIFTCSPMEPLTMDEHAFVKRTADIVAEHPLIPCIGCDLCLPCPADVDIPRLFEHCNKCLHEDNVSDTRKDPKYDRNRKIFLRGLDGTVPRLSQADHCTECGECIPKCPQRIDIPERLICIADYVEKLRRNA